jgi:glycosyltransferase involved in cell wall biosynthesis
MVYLVNLKPKTKKILYIYQYFGTPEQATGIRGYEFARNWTHRGNRVIMLTTTTKFHNNPLITGSKKRLLYKVIIDGINVSAFRLFYKQKMNNFRRMTNFFSFAFYSTIYGLFFLKGFDIVYATSTPLTVGIPALIFKLLRKKPYIFEVRDQWPQIPIAMGAIRNKLLIKILLCLEKIIYRNAEAIITLSSGMAKGVKEVLKTVNKSIYTIPNCSDLDLFDPNLKGDNIRKILHIRNKIVFLYAGSLGKVNYIDFLIEAASELKHEKDIHFIIIGFGSEENRLREQIKLLKLVNVDFLGSVPKKDLPQYYAACDVSLSLINNYPIIEHNSANKFFDSLAAGKPILLNYSGWQRELLEKYQAGLGCRLCDLEEFIKKIKYIKEHRKDLKQMGSNSRKIAETLFSREKLSLEALNVINSVLR